MATKRYSTGFKGILGGSSGTESNETSISKTIQPARPIDTSTVPTQIETPALAAVPSSRKKKRRTKKRKKRPTQGNTMTWEDAIAALELRMSKSPHEVAPTMSHPLKSRKQHEPREIGVVDKYFVLEEMKESRSSDDDWHDGNEHDIETDYTVGLVDSEDSTSSSERDGDGDDELSVASEGSLDMLLRCLTCNMDRLMTLQGVNDWDDDNPIERKKVANEHKRSSYLDVMMGGWCH